jgi:alpha-tubulin suppressor-like RCC1 family protein
MIDATACWGWVLQQRSNATPITAFNGVKAIALGSVGGSYFDCILDATGALQCQGDNYYGQYGDGTMMSVGALAPVNPPRSYLTLATNTYSPTMCGVRVDNGVECWGLNDRGQTGDTASTVSYSPNVLPLSGCIAVAVGRFHACAICDGSISCWGDNRFGQLGTGVIDAEPRPMPQVASGPPPQGAWVQIVAGYQFTCARSDAGLSQCWGFDPHAALGNGARSANLPVTVTARPAQ